MPYRLLWISSEQFWGSRRNTGQADIKFLMKRLQFIRFWLPLVFIIVTLVVWLTFTYWLTKKLKEPWNIYASVSLLIGHGYNSVAWLRTDLHRAGLFTGQDQLSKALSLIPMTVYIFFIGWIATKGFLQYFRGKNK